jgi:SAM-dependent methyltransferase
MERNEYEVLAAVEETHWWHSGMRAITAAILNPLYGTRSDLRILDAGCGTGGNARFLRRYGTVFGMDLAPEAVELSTPHVRGHLARGSVLSLPFASNSFDLVTSFDVLYHRNVPDETPALHEIRRVLGPGGRLLVRLPAYEFLRSNHDRAVHTRRRYNVSTTQAMLTAAGFIVERCTYINTLLFPAALAQRMLERSFDSLEQQQSDLALPPQPVNDMLFWPMGIEATWLSLHGSFPFGLSVLCLAHSAKYEHVRGERKTGA